MKPNPKNARDDMRTMRAEGTLKDRLATDDRATIVARVEVKAVMNPDGERAVLIFDRLGPDEIAPGVPARHEAGEIWLQAEQVSRVFDMLMQKTPYRRWIDDTAAHPLAPDPRPILED